MLSLLNWGTIITNFVYLILSCFVMFCLFVATYKVFDRFTKFDTSKHLKQGNIAVAIVYCGLLIGIGIATGLVVGLTM